MLKKRFTFLFFVCVLITLTACSQNVSNLNEDEKSITLLKDSFKHHYSVSLYQFGKITDNLSKVSETKDLNYINGLIDAYIYSNPLSMTATLARDKDTYNKIVEQDLQEAVSNLFKNQKQYIKNINDLIKHNDLEKIKSKKKQFIQLYTLERELNDNRLFDKKDLQNYKKILNDMNKTLTE
jgi:hypothetical protein